MSAWRMVEDSNLRELGIRVNAVSPGVIKMPMHSVETHAQLAKMHARALGKIKLPVVIRIPYGGGIGAV